MRSCLPWSRLLDRAAERVWALAEQEGPGSSRGTPSQVTDLLPGDVGVDVDRYVLDDEDPCGLLRAREQLTRKISLSWHSPGLSDSTVGICDLARGAKSYGD
ncbi:MAG: hypothetical protein WKF73_06985 [Nocardioidaceae bacterium]